MGTWNSTNFMHGGLVILVQMAMVAFQAFFFAEQILS
jgi:hypothetical protein